MLMNAFLNLTTVTVMLNVITQMAHLYVFAMKDIPGMVLSVKVSGQNYGISKMQVDSQTLYSHETDMHK
jgi:hypothetical protein